MCLIISTFLSVRKIKDLKFINFPQESITISECMAKFTKLGNFMTTLDMNDDRKAQYFERELRDSIR